LGGSQINGAFVNTKRTKYILISVHRKAGQNGNVKTANRSFKNVAKFRHFGKTLTNKNFVLDQSACNLIMGNACYHFVQNLLFSRLLPKSIKIKIYEMILRHWFCMGVKTWSLTLRDEHGLMVIENSVLRRIF
jgi:hypothetical protein